MQVRFDRRDIERVNTMLYGIRNGAARALMRAINETVSRTRTEANREMRKQIRVKAAYINKRFNADKATLSKPNASLSLPTRGRLLSRFSTDSTIADPDKTSWIRPPVTPKRGPAVKVKPTGRAKRMPGAFFIGPLKYSGAIGIAIRTQYGPGLGRSEGLKVLYGPSLSQVFTNVKDDLVQPSGKMLVERLDRNAQRILDQNR